MSDKPSYLSKLNAIANGERGGHELLAAWAETTPNKELAACLHTVAIREAEHAWAFEKRICELGYSLKHRENEGLADRVACVRSDRSDLEKFAELGYGKEAADNSDAEDGLLQLLADKSIDAQTGALLGRFICEERDSGRMLRAAYESVKAAGSLSEVPATAATTTATLAEICAQLARLSAQVESLSSSGKSKSKKAA